MWIQLDTTNRYIYIDYSSNEQPGADTMTKYLAYTAVTAWLAWSAVSPLIDALLTRSI